MNSRYAFWLLVTFMAPCALAADTRVISFEEAVRIALEQNTTLRQAMNMAASAEIGVSEARMQFVPDLRLNTSGSQAFGRNFNESEGIVVDRSSTSVNIGVSSGITLFNGFANTATLRGARLTDQASKLDLGRTRETVVFTVASNLLALIEQQEQLRVRRESLVAESTLLEQVETFVNAGARTVADLYQQQANLASAQLAVVDAERAAELARVDLMDTLQLDPTGVYQFEPPTAEQLGTERELPPLEQMLGRALEKRVDIEAEEARVAAAEQDIRVARSGYWPDVSLSAGYSSGYTSLSAFDFGEQLDLRRGGSMGLNLSLPLFDRRNTSNATRRAVLRTQSEQIALDELRQAVGLQVRTVYLDYRSAQERVAAADAQQRAADLALQATQQRYQAGAATLVELTQSRATQVQAASTLVSARYNLQFQRTLADYYLGELDPGRFADR